MGIKKQALEKVLLTKVCNYKKMEIFASHYGSHHYDASKQNWEATKLIKTLLF